MYKDSLVLLHMHPAHIQNGYVLTITQANCFLNVAIHCFDRLHFCYEDIYCSKSPEVLSRAYRRIEVEQFGLELSVFKLVPEKFGCFSFIWNWQ